MTHNCKALLTCMTTLSTLLACVAIGYGLRSIQEVDPITLLFENCTLIGYVHGNILEGGLVFLQEGTVKHLCDGGIFR